MTMSSSYLQKHLRLLDRAEQFRTEAIADSGGDDPGWDAHALRRTQREKAHLESLLAGATRQLEWSFSGKRVYGNTIAVNQLVHLLEPIGQTFRWTARDLIMLDGRSPATDAEISELIEPVVSGTGPGSFRVTLQRSPISEQMSLFEPSLFERVADKIVEVLRHARDGDESAVIVGSLSGFRSNTIGGFSKLARALSTVESDTRIQWGNDAVVVLTPPRAHMLAETLETVEAFEETRTVRGTLAGGDVDDERFHLVVYEADGKRDYRGAAEATAVADLRQITYGALVEAEVLVIYTDSSLLASPKESYVLQSVSAVSDE